MRKTLFVLLFLLVAQPADANPFGKFYRWAKRHRLELVADGFMLGAGAVDAEQTLQALKRCPGCQETNPFMRGRPSQADFWHAHAIEWPLEVVINHYGSHVTHEEGGTTFEQNTWVIFPASVVAWHSWGAIHNAGIKSGTAKPAK